MRVMRVSGAETAVPKLRHSTEVFQQFDEYYQLYFPHGGSGVTALLMTEASTAQLLE